MSQLRQSGDSIWGALVRPVFGEFGFSLGETCFLSPPRKTARCRIEYDRQTVRRKKARTVIKVNCSRRAMACTRDEAMGSDYIRVGSAGSSGSIAGRGSAGGSSGGSTIGGTVGSGGGRGLGSGITGLAITALRCQNGERSRPPSGMTCVFHFEGGRATLDDHRRTNCGRRNMLRVHDLRKHF